LGRVGWGSGITVVAAVFAALAAIGGLWAQAVATYWSQETAQEQLNEVRQRQASQVTIWTEANFIDDSRTRIHILNRSLDPVTSLDVVVQLFTSSGEFEATFGVGDVRPCVELIYAADDLDFSFGKGPGAAPLNSESWAVDSLHFVDRNGRHWSRSSIHLAEEASESVPSEADKAMRMIAAEKESQVRTPDGCSDGAN
jgi:hypothetical protein